MGALEKPSAQVCLFQGWAKWTGLLGSSCHKTIYILEDEDSTSQHQFFWVISIPEVEEEDPKAKCLC